MPWEYIKSRVLQATVWSHDSLQENEFLGGVELDLNTFDLREEISQWYSLSYIPRRREWSFEGNLEQSKVDPVLLNQGIYLCRDSCVRKNQIPCIDYV